MWGADAIIGVVSYSILLLVAALSYGVYLLRTRQCKFTVEPLFYSFLFSFCAVRIAWICVSESSAADIYDYVLNRVAYCFFFTAFTLVLAWWIENYRKTYITTDQFLPVMRTPLLLVNAIFYMFLGALVVVNVLDFAVDQDREANLLYNIEIFTLAIINCVIAFVFAVYGLRLLYRQQVQSDDSSESRRELLAVLMCTVVTTFAFLLRVVMYSIRPITGKYIDDTVFNMCTYWIPEIVPSVMQLVLLNRKVRKVQEWKKNIDDLYDSDALYAADALAERMPIASGTGEETYETFLDEMDNYAPTDESDVNT